MKGKRKRRKNYVGSFSLIIIILAVMAMIAVVDYYRTFYRPNVASCYKDGVTIKIEHSFSYDDLCNLLADTTVLDNPRTFLRAAKFYNLESKFHPGNYFLASDMNNKQIVRTIARGLQQPVNFVFNGYIRDMPHLAKLFSTQIDADSSDIADILLDTAVVASFGFTPETFPAMFIPNTYEVYWTITPQHLLNRLHQEYEKFWDSTRLAKAEHIGLTPNEVTTLASIVIEETKFASEMPVVAGVYMNRLHKGMALQADPTVKFLLEPGVKRILKNHLKIESPYNTYRNVGLPPGPITIPPIKAIDAVLNYTHHNYMYFCANDSFDGHHNFAANYSEHQKNAAAYQAAYNRMQREKGAARADSLAAAPTTEVSATEGSGN